MNKPLSLFTVFLACATATCGNRVAAQTTPSNSRSSNGPYRYTGGWNAVPTNPNIAAKSPLQADIRPPVQSPVVQAAFYQQPGSGMNLPGYPGNDGSGNLQPALPTGLPNNLPNSMPNALANGTSNPAPGRLSDVGMPNNMPPQNYAADNYAGSNQQLSPQPLQSQFDSYAREQQQVLPPAPMQSPYRTASTDLRAVQNDNQQYPAQQQNPLNDLRPVKPTMQRGFGTNAQQMDVATGYPFVSPPRTGNYPTSPYNSSLFRTVAYQNVVQSPQPPQTAAVANTQPTLPQYQNQPPVGIYPTQYQCPTDAATYPAAGAVPGAFVPPTLTPNLTPGTYSPNNSGYSPVFSLGQENYNVQIGRGIIGQPTVYVPGQPFRNFIRYLSP
jgi:hypothetical protein